jgi:hypothetical protein
MASSISTAFNVSFLVILVVGYSSLAALNILTHELSNYLRSRFVLLTAKFEKFLAELALDPNA